MSLIFLWMAYERSLISGFKFVNNSFGYELVCLYDSEREKKNVMLNGMNWLADNSKIDHIGCKFYAWQFNSLQKISPEVFRMLLVTSGTSMNFVICCLVSQRRHWHLLFSDQYMSTVLRQKILEIDQGGLYFIYLFSIIIIILFFSQSSVLIN